MDLLKSTASVPFDPVKAGKGEVAQRVQAATKGHTTASSRSEWMLVTRIEGSMVVEVLLDMDERDVVLCEKFSDTSSVGRLVTRDIVAIEGSRKARNVKREGVQCARSLSEAQREQ